ncbi:MAG: hypothetical protein KGL39_03290 [Patescibacteria group bacterium]|nr:hypothetical protein [Patescibacteria group bacterium]
MSIATILSAIHTQLATVTFPAAQIDFSNATFVPVAGVPYLRGSMAAQKFTALTLGTDRTVGVGNGGYMGRWDGLYHVDAVWPEDAGSDGCYSMQGQLLNLFPRGLTLITSDGVRVVFDAPTALPVRPDNAWVRGSCQFPWWALIQS